MRRSELVELRRGCCRPPEEAFDGLLRYRLDGRLIKGQQVGGVRDQWVVTEYVYRAVLVAEQLAEIPPWAHSETLFANAVFHLRYRAFTGGSMASQARGLASAASRTAR